MIFGTQPGDDWVSADYKLLEAYQTLQDETCGHCGHPIWLCRSKEDIQFDIRTDTCFADKAMQEWQETQKDKKGKSKTKHGEHPYTMPFTYDPDNNMEPSYTKLPSRKSYFEADEDTV